MWFLGTWMTNVVRVGKHRSYFAYRASTCFQTLGHPSVMLSVGRAFPHSLRQRQHFSPVLRPLTWLFPGALKGSESEEYPWEPRDNHWRDIDTGRAGVPPKGPQRVSGWTSPNPPILGFWILQHQNYYVRAKRVPRDQFVPFFRWEDWDLQLKVARQESGRCRMRAQISRHLGIM